MWCLHQRLYAVSVCGLAACTALCVCSVLLPGWATKGEGEGVVYAGLFWMCVNATFTPRSCVSGNPFEHTALEATTKFLVMAGALFQTLSVLLALAHLACCCCGPCPDSRHPRQGCRRPVWRHRSSVVEVLAIGGGLIFFVGCLCAVGFVLADERGDYTFGPSLFLALAASTLVVNFGCLVFISNRDPDDIPVFV
ncbi:hypothetical protein ACOMHN_008024 [Nucella lapillus]